jgi:hypothetical protein
MEDGASDHAGSMTMCEITATDGVPAFDCTTYKPGEDTFKTDMYVMPPCNNSKCYRLSFTTHSLPHHLPTSPLITYSSSLIAHTCTGGRLRRSFVGTDDVRLYGPSATDIANDLEPEGGAFTADGKYFLTVMQDNNAYMMFDIEAGEYIFMRFVRRNLSSFCLEFYRPYRASPVAS